MIKAQQENEWNPQIWKSEIGLRNQQGKEAGAHAGYLGKQTEWYDREAQAKIKEQEALAGYHGAQAQQAALFNKMLQQRTSNNDQQTFAQTQQPSQPQQGQSANAQQPTMNQPSANTVYGIPNPVMTNDDIINQKIFGIDTYSKKAENATKQQQDQYETFNKRLTTAVKGANAANNLDQAISVFNNAMNRASYKGSRWGNVPSSGWMTPPMSDMSPEQEADRASAQMLPDAIATLKASMGAAQFSNLDMMQAGKMKFDRTMDDNARKVQTEWVNAVNGRSKEEAKFYQAMNKPNLGITSQDADMLWRQYQENNPLIGKDSKGNDTVNFDNLGNWPLYTTPKAIKSIKETGTYKPSSSEKNVYMMEYPDKQILPVKKGRVEIAFSKGARPV